AVRELGDARAGGIDRGGAPTRARERRAEEIVGAAQRGAGTQPAAGGEAGAQREQAGISNDRAIFAGSGHGHRAPRHGFQGECAASKRSIARSACARALAGSNRRVSLCSASATPKISNESWDASVSLRSSP